MSAYSAGIDRSEADVVAGAKQDRLGRAGVVEAQRRPAEQPEAAGALHRIDGGLRPADRDAPGGSLGPGPVEPRDRQPRGLPRHVREARREADEVDVVLRPRMERHDLRGSEAEAAGDVLEIRTVLPAVRAGQLHPAPRRRRRVRQPARQLDGVERAGPPTGAPAGRSGRGAPGTWGPCRPGPAAGPRGAAVPASARARSPRGRSRRRARPRPRRLPPGADEARRIEPSTEGRPEGAVG